MRLFMLPISLACIVIALLDAFETILQPRRITHRYRLARFYYRSAWKLWREVAALLPVGKRRESFLGAFGPLSLLGLFVAWVCLLILGFGLLHWSLHSSLHVPARFWTYLYFSGSTFFTLGYGDLLPTDGPTRVLAVLEAGLGFGFLAIIISYLPALFQAFSHRETLISLLDARAGSPPTAVQFVLRLAHCKKLDSADALLAELETWAAELLESHLSFPVLSYYRSQHDNQSWLSTLTMALDTCALLLTRVQHWDSYQSQLTFAMARHAAVDLGLIHAVRPDTSPPDRLSPEARQRLNQSLRKAGIELRDSPEAEASFDQMRGMYEPFLNGLAELLLYALPPIVPDGPAVDNWQRSAWMARPPGIGSLPSGSTSSDRDPSHF